MKKVSILLLPVIIGIISCQKESKTNFENEVITESRPGKTKHWDKILDHDCVPNGKNCAVVLPDYGLTEAIQSNQIAPYVLSNNDFFGFEDDIILALENDPSIVDVKFNSIGEAQIRINH